MRECITIFLLLFSSIYTSIGKEYVLHFEYNKYAINDIDALNIIKIITSTDVKRVKINGHCDSIGSIAYNKQLSEKRVKAVVKLMTDNGIDKSLILQTIGYGKLKPLNTNYDEQERALNRRVEISFEGSELIKIDKTVVLKEKQTTVITKPSIIEKKSLQKDSFKIGEKIILENLQFEGGRHILLETSKTTLYELLDVLKKHPSMKIEIGGHVCCTQAPDGDDFDTRTANLSVNRAMEIYNFLLHFGINKTRLKVKGYGSSQKLFPLEQSSEEQTANRRVEIKILDN
jgi:outer membrane protein OmpA-like peptidoglycan-associated protein